MVTIDYILNKVEEFVLDPAQWHDSPDESRLELQQLIDTYVQQLLNKHDVVHCKELLEQKLNRVQEYNAVAKDLFVKEKSANDLHALRRVIMMLDDTQAL